MNRIASRLGLKADRVERFIALARVAIAWERVWPALWPASGIIGLFFAAALFGVFAYMPGWLHALTLIAVVLAAAGFLYLRFRALVVPDWRDGARRIERDSTLAHRPITERDDDMAVGRGDPWAEALWQAHMRRLLASIRRLRVNLPSPGLPERDPYALRFVVLLALAAGLIVAGRDWNRRIMTAFEPSLETGTTAATLDAWVNPPDYTGKAPIYLKGGGERTVTAPAGSKLVVRVHGATGTPSLSLDPSPAKQAAFTGKNGEYAANVTLKKSADVAVRSGWKTLGRWHIKAVADTPPMITFSAPPSATKRDAVKFAFTAGDDYGVAKVRAIIRPLKPGLKSHKPLIVNLPVDDPTAKTLQQTTYEDLTASPYAGLKVAITLEATDAIGQTGKSKPATFTLPARVFTNPLARALVEQRQNLAIGEMASTSMVQRTLNALTIGPAMFYSDKQAAYLAIRTAYWGVRTARVDADLTRVESLLWQTALALENGQLSAAAALLRRLQQMLSKALATGAPQQTINQLMQRYQQALNKYLQSLAQNAQHGMQQPAPQSARTISPQQLHDLLKAIQQLAQTGARNQASQMLSMLQNLLENLRLSDNTSQRGKASPGQKATQDAIKKLGDLMGKQRGLLDKTFRQGRSNQPPKPGDNKKLAQEQAQLHQQLQKILKGLPGQSKKAPPTLGQAGKEMMRSQGSLNQGDFPGSSQAQKNALEALRAGADQLAQNLMQQGLPGQQQGQNEDPLGRADGGRGLELGNVKVPDKSLIERAHKILEELRARAAQRGRPKEELDYIDRLLKEF